MHNLNKTGGIVGWVIVLLLAAGALFYYFGDEFYSEKNHICFYYGDFVKGFDMPPYVERITPTSYELKGVCDLKIQTSPEQTNNSFHAACSKYGYIFMSDKSESNAFQLEIGKGYIVSGRYADNVLKLRWAPILPDSLKDKASQIIIKTTDQED